MMRCAHIDVAVPGRRKKTMTTSEWQKLVIQLLKKKETKKEL